MKVSAESVIDACHLQRREFAFNHPDMDFTANGTCPKLVLYIQPYEGLLKMGMVVKINSGVRNVTVGCVDGQINVNDLIFPLP